MWHSLGEGQGFKTENNFRTNIKDDLKNCFKILLDKPNGSC